MHTGKRSSDLRWDKAFVLGNGPSLRSVDLKRFVGVPTVGMNAAYRYWEKIGWYPTHYCCLDEELASTHHEAIAQLLDKGLVETAFLTGRVLEFRPDLAGDERCLFLDQFLDSLHEARGRRFGLPFLRHPAFLSSAPSKLTTGAYAVRYAIYLGYRAIYLAGIDCNYVEMVDGAKRRDGIALEMVETPSSNPNYFFDDYQQAGDRYNLPNPSVHGGNLHLQALEAVRDDAVNRRLPVEIVNCAPQSQLSVDGVFPYESLDRALGQPLLGAVAIPLTPSEEARVHINLRAWNRPELVPRLPGSEGYPVALVLALNRDRDRALEQRIQATFDECDNLRSSFSRLEFEYCSLEPHEDVYEKDHSRPPPAEGYSAGPNNQFFESMRRLGKYGQYCFYMETDCIPIRPDWLSRLEGLVEGTEPFWVCGSVYRGVGTVGTPHKLHINGNAIYAAGDEGFQNFVREVWRPAVKEHVDGMPGIAYDFALAYYFRDASPHEDVEKWRLLQEVAHLFRFTDMIQNHGGNLDAQSDLAPDLREIRERSPMTYIVHGRHLADGLPGVGIEQPVVN